MLCIAAVQRDFIAIDIIGFVDGDTFEFDGGLRFVVDGAAIQHHGGDGIEEPAQAGCERRIQAALDHARKQARFPFGRADKFSISAPSVETCGVEVRERHAPGLAHGGIAAGHGHVVEMSEAFEAVEPGNQNFPAPDAAVGAVAGAIEREADDRPLQTVLGHAAGDVGMMMLNPISGRPRAPAHCFAHEVER